MHDKSDAGDTSSNTKKDYCSVSLLKSLTWAEVGVKWCPDSRWTLILL